jgi:hypothetical protein
VKILASKLGLADLALANLQRQISDQEKNRRAATDSRRAAEIRDFFNQKMVSFSAALDVQVEDRRRTALHVAGKARGSEGARELAAYYYAFLHTIKHHSTSVYCPIVVDAPNQQGQDAVHLPRVLKFLIEECPKDSQLIVAVEDASPIRDRDDVDVVRVGVANRQVLDPEQFEAVRGAVAPYLDKLLKA